LCVKPVIHAPSHSPHHRLQIVCFSLPPFVVRTDENKEPGWNIGWVVKNFPVPCLKGIGSRAYVLFSQLLEHPSYT